MFKRLSTQDSEQVGSRRRPVLLAGTASLLALGISGGAVALSHSGSPTQAQAVHAVAASPSQSGRGSFQPACISPDIALRLDQSKGLLVEDDDPGTGPRLQLKRGQVNNLAGTVTINPLGEIVRSVQFFVTPAGQGPDLDALRQGKSMLSSGEKRTFKIDAVTAIDPLPFQLSLNAQASPGTYPLVALVNYTPMCKPTADKGESWGVIPLGSVTLT